MNDANKEWKKCQMGLYLELDPRIVEDVIRVVEDYKNEAVNNALNNSATLKPLPPSPSPSTKVRTL